MPSSVGTRVGDQGGASARDVSGYRSSLAEFASELDPARVWSVVDWAFVALSFGLAIVFGKFAWVRLGDRGETNRRQLLFWGAALVSVEALFAARIVYAAPVKRALHEQQLGLEVAAICTAAVVSAALLYSLKRRDVVVNWLRDHLVSCVVLGYLLTTIIRPCDTLGLLGIIMVAAFAYSSRWPLHVRALTVTAFAAYFTIASRYLWPMLGERIAARYAVGLPVAAVGVLALGLLHRGYALRNDPFPYAQLVGVAMLLILLPAGGLGLVGWSAADYGPLASLVLVLMCFWIRVIGKPPWWSWVGPLLVIVFWLWPSPALFSNSLGTCVLILSLALAQYRERQDCRLATFVLLTSMLMLMSTPAKALTLFLLLGVLIAFMISSASNEEGERPSDIVFAALFVVTCRYAVFNLYGNSDSMWSFGLQDIDIGSAYVGNEQREIVPAIMLALLKVWVAGAVLFAGLGLFRKWRRWLISIAAFSAMFALINLGQASVQAALATGVRTAQYEWAAFSVFANTGIFVFAMLSFAAFANFADESDSTRGPMKGATAYP